MFNIPVQTRNIYISKLRIISFSLSLCLPELCYSNIQELKNNIKEWKVLSYFRDRWLTKKVREAEEYQTHEKAIGKGTEER